MEKGVYVRSFQEDNLKQIIFLEIIPIGTVYERTEYRVKRISFTLVNPETAFLAFQKYKYSVEEIFDFSPLLVNKESKIGFITEGGTMYEYYSNNYTPCNISFRFIEHLYENFKSIQDTLKDLLAKTVKE